MEFVIVYNDNRRGARHLAIQTRASAYNPVSDVPLSEAIVPYRVVPECLRARLAFFCRASYPLFLFPVPGRVPSSLAIMPSMISSAPAPIDTSRVSR